MFILEEEDQELFDRVQEQNLNRQYELLTNCIEIGLRKGPAAFDKYFLWALNHVAVATISQFGGKILDTLTRLHFSIPAFLRASSRDCSFSLCLPTPFVKNIFFGTDCILFRSYIK